ncbi:EscR/YscR/HrcR family type III secretion system export apparatus protein [Chromobacterium piscinae]|uniref:EscR/YscR/HrcR family type III secretion system export apparatus protein n=1 Tax=Chromobacterium piscinae TaxID=686831 RepID=A0ABV0HAD1_9NEIS
MSNDIPLIALLSLATLIPFLVASGTCFIKFSIVFVMVRNALGLQGVPSNITLNGVALLLSLFVMLPVGKSAYEAYRSENVNVANAASVQNFIENGLDGYRAYLKKYADPKLVTVFEKSLTGRLAGQDGVAPDYDAKDSIVALLPAYALSEIKSAFTIGFYLYLPFVVIDLVVSSILLALGMMMMSPVTVSTPIKLVLFVVMDGWTILSTGMIQQYLDLAL